MEESGLNAFNKKVKLIYEYNRNSPLFVKIADSEIEENNVDSAVDILHSGLKTYPDNPVALFLLGKAYALMGNYNKATEFFRRGSNICQSEETYKHYLREIESLKKRRSLFETTRGKSFYDPSEIDDEETKGPDLFNPEDKNQSEQELVSSIDEKLSHLADEISKAKLSNSSGTTIRSTDFENVLVNDNMIISETLAKIYIAQHEYDEAIKVYELLIKKNPANSENYSGRIREIRAMRKS